MNLPEDFQFSQSSLQDFVECARRFELRYLKQQKWPSVQSEPLLEYERHMQQGEAFHHLVHQHLSGVPEKALSSTIRDAQLESWWTAYLRTGLKGLPAQRHPEITMTASIDDYGLTATYDLIAAVPGERLVIVDWKTTRQKPKNLSAKLQTVVYRYLLVKAGAFLNGGQLILPEQVEMIYWFAEQPDESEHFPYDAAQFAADEASLLDLVTHIDQMTEFPLTDEVYRCGYCTYRSLCERGVRAGHMDDMDADVEPAIETSIEFSLDQIAEIEF